MQGQKGPSTERDLEMPNKIELKTKVRCIYHKISQRLIGKYSQIEENQTVIKKHTE